MPTSHRRQTTSNNREQRILANSAADESGARNSQYNSDGIVNNDRVTTNKNVLSGNDDEGNDSTGGGDMELSGDSVGEDSSSYVLDRNRMLHYDDSINLCCFNCRRKQNNDIVELYGSSYQMNFYTFSSVEVNARRRFKFVRSANDESNAVELLMCEECAIHLTMDSSKENEKVFNSPQMTWPGFIWSIISDTSLRSKYGTRIWQMIPQTWRYWWVENSSTNFNSNVFVHHPQSLFVDKTNEMDEWNTDIESMSLSRLRDTSNKHLMPCVLCPWGCSEFLHCSGHIPLDVIFQRYLSQHIIKKTFTNQLHSYVDKVEYARNDYLRKSSSDYEYWLLNKEWYILPTIQMTQKHGPVVLTCRWHNHGRKK